MQNKVNIDQQVYALCEAGAVKTTVVAIGKGATAPVYHLSIPLEMSKTDPDYNEADVFESEEALRSALRITDLTTTAAPDAVN